MSFLCAGHGAKFKGGYGVAHIIAKRSAEGHDGEAIARAVPETIARGKTTMRGPDGARRAEIDYGRHHVTLSECALAPGMWLLTSFIDETR